jgi:DNA-binding CsgD family transcriptional regulator
LAALRTGEESFLDRAGLPEYELAPLAPPDAAELMTARFPALAPAVRGRLLSEAAGNPLAVLELPAALSGPQGDAVRTVPAVLPLTRRLQGLFAAKVAEMPPQTRTLLLLIALSGRGDLRILDASGSRPAGVEALVPAERARLAYLDEITHRLTFRHPLIRAVVVDMSTGPERRAAHTALADLSHGQPDRRSWHLGQAALDPDETVAALLEASAHRILRRGDAVGAVAALTRAAELSPHPTQRARRLAEAAYIAADVTGDLGQVSRLLEEAKEADPDLGQTLGAALGGAYLLLNSDGQVDTAHRLLVAAIEAYPQPFDPSDETIVAALTVLLAVCNFGGRGELWGPFDAALGRFTPGPPANLQLLSRTYPDPVRRAGPVLGELDAAIAALSDEVEQSRIMEVCGAATYLDRLGACREPMWRVVHDGRQSGAVAPAITALTLLAADDYQTGQWDEAETLLGEALGLCETHGYRLWSWPLQNLQARLAAVRGDYEATWKLTDEVSRWAEPRGVRMIRWNCCHTRALAALGQGEFDYAYQQVTAVTPVGTFASFVPHALWVGMDLVEAAVHTDRRQEAASHVRAMRDQDIAALSPRLALLTAGSAAMAAPQEEAEFHFEQALTLPGAEHWPFDLARVQLAYGERLRRARSLLESRSQLRAALETFERLRARPWADRAAQELRATGQSKPRADESHRYALTPQELEIATLAAKGLTNKQIGERLFMSHRTVGAHLYRIFPKLGITSRAALRDALGALPNHQPDGTN